MFIQWHNLIDALPLWGLFMVILVGGLLALEVGIRIGRRWEQRLEHEQEVVARGLVGGMLGLEAFMLAFTFGAAATHFNARRQAVTEEANAIRTAYLRADLLPEPHSSEIRNLLREYGDVRLLGDQYNINEVRRAIARSEELHNELWLQMVASKDKTPSPALAVQFIQALNEVFSAHTRRVVTGVEYRVPSIVWIVLYSLTALAAASIGYHSALTGRARPILAIGLILAFSAVIVLIEDLDRPMYGVLEVGQRALIDLQRTMNGRTP